MRSCILWKLSPRHRTSLNKLKNSSKTSLTPIQWIKSAPPSSTSPITPENPITPPKALKHSKCGDQTTFYSSNWGGHGRCSDNVRPSALYTLKIATLQHHTEFGLNTEEYRYKVKFFKTYNCILFWFVFCFMKQYVFQCFSKSAVELGQIAVWMWASSVWHVMVLWKSSLTFIVHSF